MEERGFKKRRVESEDVELETEDTIDPAAYREFEKRMVQNNSDKGSDA